MLTRKHGYLHPRRQPAGAAAQALAETGCVRIRNVLSADEVEALKAEIAQVFETSEPDRAGDQYNEFRHGMFNRSPLSQKAIGARAILDAIEPLLGEDCHVIANTAWRNRRGHQGGAWHIDSGPHVPRPEGVAWPDAIPYPVFAIGMHLFLEDCPAEAGPTAVLPGSHRSGRTPPKDRLFDLTLTYDNKEPILLTAKAGDATLFVSDAWHRGTPAQEGFGRFFLQAHYGRRDIQQRVFTTEEISHALPEAAARAETDRERALIGLHKPFFYDG